VISPPPYEWITLAWAGVLLGRASARLGGRAAGYLGGLMDVPPALIEVRVPESRMVRSRSCWTFVRERPGVRPAASTGSPPRVPLEDTVLDLTDQATDARTVIDLVTRAVQTRRTTVTRLRSAVQGRCRLRHRLLLEVLADVAAGAHSPLELRYLRDVERPHRLPKGERQRSRSGCPEARDVWYEPYRTVVELDGRLGHGGRGRFRDMRRDNASLVAGDATLRYGWEDVDDRACTVAWEVGGVLGDRGWTGQPAVCPRCRRSA
jgi:hypothetical protein